MRVCRGLAPWEPEALFSLVKTSGSGQMGEPALKPDWPLTVLCDGGQVALLAPASLRV